MKRYRTFWRRFWAGFVDGLVFLPIALGDEFFLSPNRGEATILVWAVVSYSSYWLYSVLMHARFGQTLGKMVTGVQVLDLTESRIPTWKQVVMRDLPWTVTSIALLGYLFVLVLTGNYSKEGEFEGIPGAVIASLEGVWFLLELITMMTNHKRRALHDYLAGTVVIRKSEMRLSTGGTVPTADVSVPS